MFYIDRRSPTATDYSQPLRAFCARHRLPPAAGAPRYSPGAAHKVHLDEESGYGVADMAEVTFDDLVLQVNGPLHSYVYCHQVGCVYCPWEGCM